MHPALENHDFVCSEIRHSPSAQARRALASLARVSRFFSASALAAALAPLTTHATLASRARWYEAYSLSAFEHIHFAASSKHAWRNPMLPEGLGPSIRSTSAANGIEDFRCDSPPRWPRTYTHAAWACHQEPRIASTATALSSQDIPLSVCVGNAPTLADDGAHSPYQQGPSRVRLRRARVDLQTGYYATTLLLHTTQRAPRADSEANAARLLETRVVTCPTRHSPSATRFYQQLAAAASPTHRPSSTT
ncbi:hypothetical protein K438DRAFT_1982398 [Mycena galopus ATCC 62051]|nr:hypothetical protein K438DRAFT_1982398 [Mycena galopus ATCC 62051]